MKSNLWSPSFTQITRSNVLQTLTTDNFANNTLDSVNDIFERNEQGRIDERIVMST